ncbi:Methyltransferase domain-containing protein [Haladaptatus litoreus]|uniref:Methyltransferase domain-containing protein n=1 Tax=Haladaptatus litoreus TaxID=553468 RepID=A0A1N7BUA0_9EURY|nr:class I SAM-dependent methyltransferase [Haladaptatus litoreus]SIR54813.1 Methyltransferase domain-containing protein [Haladaptatus litoreus]
MTDEREQPLALSAYEQLADDYAERAPTKPFNADLERPTTQGLLPDIAGMDVLDAGCGPGITTEYLLDEGAEVTGIDASPSMLSHARERAPDAEFLRCDFGEELPFESNRFDLVYSSLAFDYVEDWDSLFAELARVLRTDGLLVFSSGHPVADYFHFDPENYFETEVVSEVWTSFGDPVEVPTYRRPLSAILNPLLAAGFRLDRIEESQPTDAFREKAPETFERVSREPTFLSIRAVMTAN